MYVLPDYVLCLLSLKECNLKEMLKARKYIVKKHFEGVPKRDDFEIVEFVLPALKLGEVLVKTEWISVDPYLRARNAMYRLPFDQFSSQIGQVIESHHNKYPVGTKIVSHIGWCDYGIVDMNEEEPLRTYKLPDFEALPTSYGIGVLGRPGATAYFGLLDICKPKFGETVVVTGAAGAVGSLVGQIAKIQGCRVIGFTGSDKKVRILEDELGFDFAFNYKTVDISEVLKNAAPYGVDCYFDNVGGEISSVIIKEMNTFGRVACCGSISSYNDNPDKMSKASIVQPFIAGKQIQLEGFNVSRFADRWHEALPVIVNWIKTGQLKVKEHVTIGFDNVFGAFVGMLAGENVGKAVVRM
ncbi:PREDICTED: prostaglandin reductase 1-like isoform X2 [Papilio polytes]|uniref:prostaglandin reductase 1-like isoform X2 n=1 Tax=Papilio polytes TaxID=76194 RepID=UPI000675E15F|nr:PREDICTED: prostaglandin reductase 1-like isoform X2 [Papilio polytes]